MTEVVDARGSHIEIGGLIGKGGEGSVHEIASSPDLLAKIYHSPLSSTKADKLSVMSTLGTPGLSKLTAWPAGLLYSRGSGAPVGLLMPRVRDRKDIHLLYGPKSRKVEFARADWRFLVRAASNTARAVAAVHSVGCVIGDVNHGGVLVAQDATVSLIDCDSFQVVSNGKKFLCDVGVETFTPPELQGRPFSGVLRTEDHDAFGMAVMVFLLLFMGKHPFSGRYSGPGDMPVGKAIEEYRFAYGASRSALLMDPPPGAMPLSYVGNDMVGLFEQAFSNRAVSTGRPDARRWISALEHLERTATKCSVQSSHWYPGHLTSCPWCKMEQATGTLLFPIVVEADTSGAGDVEALWLKLRSLPQLGPSPVIDAPTPTPSSDAVSIERPSPEPPDEAIPIMPSISFGLAAFVVIILLTAPFGLAWMAFVGAIVVGVGFYKRKETGVGKNNATKAARAADERARFRAEIDRLEAEVFRRSRTCQELLTRWRRDTAPDEFERRLTVFSTIRDRWNDLPERRKRALDDLRRDLRRSQLEAYLDRVDIASAVIDGVGPGRKQTLSSYGIETARDVDFVRLQAVPKFGPKTISNMMIWRHLVEARFIFDPTRPVDPRQITALEQAVLSEKAKLRSEAKNAQSAASQAHAAIIANRRVQRPALEAAVMSVAQAKADLAHLTA